MAEYKRRAGVTLGLSLALSPRDDSKFVRAFLTDKSGAALATPSVDLTSIGGGIYVDNTFTMPSTAQVRARYVVFEDSGYTQEDCEHPGDTDTFDLDDLLPSQLPGDEVLTAEVDSVELEAEVSEGELEANVESGSVEADLDEVENLEAEADATDLEADTDSSELEGNIEC